MNDQEDRKEKTIVNQEKQVSSFINEGNPNVRENGRDQEIEKVVKQAIKDDQALAPVAQDILVTVHQGEITLEGEVSTDQQLNLATNTATALGTMEEIKNELKVVPKENVNDMLKEKS
jgi:osmotically-inducible protein OsmY